MAERVANLAGVSRGEKDPREYFPTFPVFIAALRQAMVAHNTKPIDSRVYGERWVPAIEYEKRKPETMMPVPAALRREALPAEKVVTLEAQRRLLDPLGLPTRLSA